MRPYVAPSLEPTCGPGGSCAAADQTLRNDVLPMCETDRNPLLHELVATRDIHGSPAEYEGGTRWVDVRAGFNGAAASKPRKCEADVLAPEARQLGLARPAEIVIEERRAAAGRRVEAAEQVEQRRLAAARRSQQDDELAAVDVEIDAAQRVHVDLADAVRLRQPARDQDPLANVRGCAHAAVYSVASWQTSARALRRAVPPARCSWSPPTSGPRGSRRRASGSSPGRRRSSSARGRCGGRASARW